MGLDDEFCCHIMGRIPNAFFGARRFIYDWVVVTREVIRDLKQQDGNGMENDRGFPLVRKIIEFIVAYFKSR